MCCDEKFFQKYTSRKLGRNILSYTHLYCSPPWCYIATHRLLSVAKTTLDKEEKIAGGRNAVEEKFVSL